MNFAMTSKAYAVAASVLAAALMCQGAAAAAPRAPRITPAPVAMAPAPALPQLPPEAIDYILVQSTLQALNDANLTNSYSVIHGMGSQAMRLASTPAQLGDNFRAFRDAKIDIGAIALVTPRWKEAPSLDKQGVLRLVGYMPTQPMQVAFNLQYQRENDRWRLSAIAVGLEPAAQVR